MNVAACRRCTECEGQDHHWLDNGAPLPDACPHGMKLVAACLDCLTALPAYVCKHCDATCNAVHAYNGNCWDPHEVYACAEDEACDVCRDHDEPRGECSACTRCDACDAEDGVVPA